MKKILILFVSTLLLFYSSTLIKADDYSDKVRQIEELEKKVATLQSQAQTLAGQITYYDSQIQLTLLKISQTEDQITSLTSKINQLESKLQARSQLLEKQIVQTYKRGGLDSLQAILSSDSFSTAVSRFKYLQIVQTNNRKFLYETQRVQANYGQQKDLVEVAHKKLQAQKASLASLKVERENLLLQTQNSEAVYQKQLEQARRELAAIKRFVSTQGGASILTNQTFCDGWGCYYNQRDSQWGTTPLGNSNLSTAEYGCLVSSSAMIATHYGKNLKPLDIAVTSGAFFSNTGLLWDTVTANGITIKRTKFQPRSTIDSELSAGRPVIVGLYSGPAHFIVLKSGSNGNYIMNDPFMENGHDVSFSSKYSVSDITDVEKVAIE